MARSQQMGPSGLTRSQVDEFELVSSQLERFHTELQTLSKGKGNDALNEFKLSLLNKLLKRANALLGAHYEPIAGFEQFESEQLTSTSDGLLVVSQYLGALEKMRADNISQRVGVWYWLIDSQKSDLRAAAPEKLRKR